MAHDDKFTRILDVDGLKEEIYKCSNSFITEETAFERSC